MRADATVKTTLRPRRKVQRWVVRVVTGPDSGLEASLPEGRSIAVGTSGDNELKLSDPTVSRYHAEVSITPDGARVRDLGSSNGIALGSVLVSDMVAAPGTRIRLGCTEIVLDSSGSFEPKRVHTPVPVPGLIGTSRAMAEVSNTVHQLASSEVSVLIQGETGTGKELLANAIHEMSARRKGPLVVVDCGSLPANLIASELFGHERGAFTDATTRRLGAFERAHGGTLFLDEVGEIALELQPVLLGALERRRFRRLGGSEEVEVDVRVLAATHRDLREDVNRGLFRPDLYFRLAVARLQVPPLRERPEDIPALATYFAEQLTGVPGESPFDDEVLASLARHRWSGNVRELRNVVEAALATGRLTLDRSVDPESRDAGDLSPYRVARAEAVAAFERDYLGQLIEECNGNASEAARRAQMDRPYLLTLLRRHGLR